MFNADFMPINIIQLNHYVMNFLDLTQYSYAELQAACAV